MIEDLKIIKKLYGEKMAHLCREFFPTILETNGLLPKLLMDNFAKSHELCDDLIANNMLESFKTYIFNLYNNKDNQVKKTDLTPKELMKQTGYILYECQTEEEIQAFKKYYAKGEELCTFHGGRLNSCYVFFAVKENIDMIRRRDFLNPQRQDEYGTSCISIQFTKDATHTLSIKNRYNHTVLNPDATFGNDLEQIIPGLTDSFEQTYGLKQAYKNGEFEIPGYVKANDGRWYKYNLEINNTYYCPDNIIIDRFDVKQFDKEKYIVMDYFILDLVKKEINVYDFFRAKESLPDVIGKIKSISINKNGKEKEITIINDNNEEIIITINKDNQIIGFKSIEISSIAWDDFLRYNKSLSILEMPNLEHAGDNFLCDNLSLTKLDLPKLEYVGSHFVFYNKIISSVNMPALRYAGSAFLHRNKGLMTLDLPLLHQVNDYFLYYNELLASANLPSLKKVGDYFLFNNRFLKTLELPLLQQAERSFLYWNQILRVLKLPLLQEVGDDFLYYNESLMKVELPSLRRVGKRFFQNNKNVSGNLLNSIQMRVRFIYLNLLDKFRSLQLDETEQIKK